VYTAIFIQTVAHFDALLDHNIKLVHNKLVVGERL
jgi:hypothetical protein